MTIHNFSMTNFFVRWVKIQIHNLAALNKGDMTNKEILEMPIVQDHERLKKEYCKMWQQQEKLLKSHVLLVEMLSERNERIKELELELTKRQLKQ